MRPHKQLREWRRWKRTLLWYANYSFHYKWVIYDIDFQLFIKLYHALNIFLLAGELPEGSQCDFDTRHFDDQMFDTLAQYSEVCGWKIPHHSAKSMSDILANGAVDKHSSLKIDLEIKPNEKIILSSPVFPPPPKYNNDKASPFFESCKVMSIHLTSYFLFYNVWLINYLIK